MISVLEGLKVNIEHEFSSEKNAQVRRIIQNSFCPTYLHNDIADRVKKRPAADNNLHLHVAGIPCQPFSKAGSNMGVGDPQGRGIIYLHVVTCLRNRQPRCFILENVENLTRTLR